jgi:lipoate-protein ligase A
VQWRLLVREERSGLVPDTGPFNMGVDEALLGTALCQGLPSLRFYTWDRPWLSVGYAQQIAPAERSRFARAGVGWVRRLTGGRAVLHGADLTYTIAAPEGALPEGIRESYSAIADALLRALLGLGVPATRSEPGLLAPGAGVFDCFARPARDEICLAGRKLSGSAQRRVGGALLQHGSIRLGPDPAAAVRAVSALAVGGKAVSGKAVDGKAVEAKAGEGATSLAECGHDVSARSLADACARAFAERLGVRLRAGTLSPEELRQARARGPQPVSPSHLRDASDHPPPPNP